MTTNDRHTSMALHPDGLLLAIGTQAGQIHIYDLKTQNRVASLECGGAVESIAFSENGFYVAVTTASNLVKIVDLRHLKDAHTFEAAGVRCAAFDHSGSYVALGGDAVTCYATKSFDGILNLPGYVYAKTTFIDSAQITGVKFGPDARFFATVSLDRHLRLYTE